MSMCRSTDQRRSAMFSMQRSSTSSLTLPRGRSSRLNLTPRMPRHVIVGVHPSASGHRCGRRHGICRGNFRSRSALRCCRGRARWVGRRRHARCRSPRAFFGNAPMAPPAACTHGSRGKEHLRRPEDMKMGVAGVRRRCELGFACVGIGRHAVGHRLLTLKCLMEPLA